VTVVSDASPLIALARIDCLDLLPKHYGTVLIPAEVYAEVVVAAPDLPGARQIAGAGWIEVAAARDPAGLDEAVRRTGLGTGEVSAVLLAKEMAAGLVLIDERRARRFAKSESEGLEVMGCLGILETMYRRAQLRDLRDAYKRLLGHDFRIDRRALQESLARLQLPPL